MINKITGFVMLGVVAALLGGIGEMTYFGDPETARLTVLMTAPKFTEGTNLLVNMWEGATFGWDWITNLIGMLFFDYSFFQGEWQIVRYILIIPISIGIIYGLVAMARGTNA